MINELHKITLRTIQLSSFNLSWFANTLSVTRDMMGSNTLLRQASSPQPKSILFLRPTWLPTRHRETNIYMNSMEKEYIVSLSVTPQNVQPSQQPGFQIAHQQLVHSFLHSFNYQDHSIQTRTRNNKLPQVLMSFFVVFVYDVTRLGCFYVTAILSWG